MKNQAHIGIIPLLLSFIPGISMAEAAGSVPFPADTVQNTRMNDFEGLYIHSIDQAEVPQNNYWIREERHRLNYPEEACFLNGEYIHSFAGFDTRKLEQEGGHLWNEHLNRKAPEEIVRSREAGGRRVRYIISSEYRPEVVSLQDIVREHAPARTPMNSCIFMLDGQLLTHALPDFRFDKHYLRKISAQPVQAPCLMPDAGRKPRELWLLHLQTPRYAPSSGEVLTIRDSQGGKSLSYNPSDPVASAREIRNVFLNGHEIGSLQGIDTDSLLALPAEKTDIQLISADNGYEVRFKTKAYRPKLISLQDVLDKYYPEQEGYRAQQRYLFFVNDSPVPVSLLPHLRLDKDYIHTVQVFDDCGAVSWEDVILIRIYTKTQAYKKQKAYKNRRFIR